MKNLKLFLLPIFTLLLTGCGNTTEPNAKENNEPENQENNTGEEGGGESGENEEHHDAIKNKNDAYLVAKEAINKFYNSRTSVSCDIYENMMYKWFEKVEGEKYELNYITTLKSTIDFVNYKLASYSEYTLNIEKFSLNKNDEIVEHYENELDAESYKIEKSNEHSFNKLEVSSEYIRKENTPLEDSIYNYKKSETIKYEPEYSNDFNKSMDSYIGLEPCAHLGEQKMYTNSNTDFARRVLSAESFDKVKEYFNETLNHKSNSKEISFDIEYTEKDVFLKYFYKDKYNTRSIKFFFIDGVFSKYEIDATELRSGSETSSIQVANFSLDTFNNDLFNSITTDREVEYNPHNYIIPVNLYCGDTFIETIYPLFLSDSNPFYRFYNSYEKFNLYRDKECTSQVTIDDYNSLQEAYTKFAGSNLYLDNQLLSNYIIVNEIEKTIYTYDDYFVFSSTDFELGKGKERIEDHINLYTDYTFKSFNDDCTYILNGQVVKEEFSLEKGTINAFEEVKYIHNNWVSVYDVLCFWDEYE